MKRFSSTPTPTPQLLIVFITALINAAAGNRFSDSHPLRDLGIRSTLQGGWPHDDNPVVDGEEKDGTRLDTVNDTE